MDARRYTESNPPPLIRPGEKTLFTPIPDWLAERAELSWPAKYLYARLVRYCGRRIAARPTWAQLGRDMNATTRSVANWLAELRQEHDGMPLIWSRQGGDGKSACYGFTAHPWRAERIVDNSGRAISAVQDFSQLKGSAMKDRSPLKTPAVKDRPRAVVGDNKKRRQSALRAGTPSGRSPVFTDRGSRTGQRRISQLLAGIGGKG